MKKKLIQITEEEYKLLKFYKKDAREVIRFLKMHHHDIYIDICMKKLREVENKIVELEKRSDEKSR